MNSNEKKYNRKRELFTHAVFHELFDKGYKKWTKEDIIHSGNRIDDVLPWLQDWQERGLIKIYGEDDIYFEVLKSYNAKKMLQSIINQYHYDGDAFWKKIRIIKYGLSIGEVTPWLKEWEAKGFIKFIGKDDEFFKVLKPIKED